MPHTGRVPESAGTRTNTVEHGRKITQNFLGEHKVITPEQQFLIIILWLF